MTVDNKPEPVTQEQESTFEKLFANFFSNFKQKYSENKKIIDRVTTVILIVAVIGVIYANNVSKAKKQAEAVSGNFFIQLYNNNDELFNTGENIVSNYLGKSGTEAALFLLANQYLEKRNEPERAIEILEAVMNNYPKNDVVSFATSKLAYLYTYTEPSKSIVLFNSLIRDFEDSPLTNKWRMDLARLLADTDKSRSVELCEFIVKNEKIDRELKQQASNLLAILNS